MRKCAIFWKNKACTYVYSSVGIEDISKNAPILKLWVQCKEFECKNCRAIPIISVKDKFVSKKCGNVAFFEGIEACTYDHISMNIGNIFKNGPILESWVQDEHFMGKNCRVIAKGLLKR